MTGYSLDPALAYRSRKTGEECRAMRWDGTPATLRAFAGETAESPAPGSYLVRLNGVVMALSPDEFEARYEFVEMGELSGDRT